jgi:phosphoglycerate dehydrogenase-like enzyme
MAGAVSAAVPAAAAGRREPVVQPVAKGQDPSAAGDPITLVTTYAFEPHEIREIEEATAPAKIDWILCKSRDEFKDNLPKAEVVYGGLREGDINLAHRLKWMQAGGAGVENMPPDFMRSEVVLTNYARTFAPGISETAMGLLLCLTKGIRQWYLPQFLKRQWTPMGAVKSEHHVELEGRVMGIIGMGGIGTAVARRAHYGFDMVIVGTDAKPMPKPDFVAELHDPTWLMTMVPQVDVLVVAAPHTKETERMIDEKVFRAMKKTAYFLALSRGALFDDMALVKALKEGWIAGAGLDVFPMEPVPSDHPIFDCETCVMTPHTSGWSRDRQIRLISLFADNMRRYAHGLPLVNVVDKKAGY